MKKEYQCDDEGYYVNDANGNVINLIDASDSSISATYDYGPFGELVRATGDMADENRFRFSSKYQDEETGLSYYGYRYYSADLGRWLNRDPVGERGGINLYAFVGNDGVNWVDLLGLAKCHYVYYAGVHRGVAEDLLDDFWEDSNGCSGAWSTGCKLFEDNPLKQNKYNRLYRPGDASQFDSSYAGYGKRASVSSGNRHFNAIYDDGQWNKHSQEWKDQQSRNGYARMVTHDWKELKAEAEAASEDCKCECKEIVLEFNLTNSASFARKVRGTNFEYPENIKKLPCKK